MRTQIAAIRVVGPAGEAFAIAENAARLAFPATLMTRVEKFSELGEQEFAAGMELLVLLSAAEAELDRATAALDARGWPRWAVVGCSLAEVGAGSHAITIAPDDWSVTALVPGFRAAVRLQAMKSVIAHLEGDMRTISRRLGHDMRGQLNSIITTSEAMLDPDENPVSPRAVFAQSIVSSVDEILRLFDRMSFILRATTNPAPRQTVIMEEIVWGALQRLESRMLKAGCTVIKPPQWPIVEGVPTWLDVIWTNLLANSLEHSGPNPRIELGWEHLPDGHRFWVRDQGREVPSKQEGLLFYPLDRLSEVNAPRGLGLPIVQRLVDLQGGRSGHDREPGGSGTFYFTLPSADPGPAP
jgi:signal transduction histidine kinase